MLRWLAEQLGLKVGDADVYARFNNAPQGYVIFFIVVAIVAYVVWNYRRESEKVPGWIRACLGAIRVLVILLVLLILFEPVLVLEDEEIRPSTTIVMVDASLSMSIKDKYTKEELVVRIRDALGKAVKIKTADDETITGDQITRETLQKITRMDLVNALLTHPEHRVLERLESDQNRVRLYQFAAVITPSARRPDEPEVKPGEIQASGSTTRLGDSLREAINDLKGQSIAAVVILTDGRSNSGEPPVSAASYAKARKIPVFTVGIGNPEKTKDIQVVAVEGPPVVFAGERDSVTAKVFVRNLGYAGRTVDVVLMGPKGELTRKEVELEDTKDRQVVELQFKVPEPGSIEAVAKIEVQADEFIADNNAESYTLEVKDRKIKVLYVEGLPRWEYRYLRHALERDDTVECSILLQTGTDTFFREGDLKIDGFPETEKDLFVYDVIVMGDVDLEAFTAEQVTMLVKFVDTIGGGLMMIAGERHMPNDFARSAELRPLLPVLVSAGASSMGLHENITQDFRLELTRDGRKHPICRLSDDENENREIWENLPGVFWYYPVKGAKAAATVIAVHPFDRNAANEKRPLIAMQFYGAGRTMFIGVDSLWRWRFLVGDRYHYRFYNQAIRHLSAGKILGKLKNIALSMDQTEFTLGQPVRMRLVVKDREFKPVIKPEVQVQIQTAGREPRTVTLKALPGGKGIYEGDFMPSGRGTYQVHYNDESAVDKTDSRLQLGEFRVRMPALEFEDPRMDEALLRNVANEAGGQYVTVDNFHKLPDKIESREMRIPSIDEHQLFDHWLLILAFSVLICAEWGWRKYVRML